ncbi:uncharacterized protein BJ212DRAFT_694575 [Suillus subaureus]|uniref:Uncharacterized protein n=1 Tax=Suillus subaureus TaxID=48587 RepID=A0A9P7EK44_9AGAM|nr:uncharacterized protein BJ212DRAFT_694575 [Suillus subaureus]KAG1823624.1 hypothetical protein BJ212DRAFT_694575 [Suillus subaureus]
MFVRCISMWSKFGVCPFYRVVLVFFVFVGCVSIWSKFRLCPLSELYLVALIFIACIRCVYHQQLHYSGNLRVYSYATAYPVYCSILDNFGLDSITSVMNASNNCCPNKGVGVFGAYSPVPMQ